MSADRPGKAGSPAFPKKVPILRLVKSPDERPLPEPALDLKAIIEDMNRRHARRELVESDTSGKTAA